MLEVVAGAGEPKLDDPPKLKPLVAGADAVAVLVLVLVPKLKPVLGAGAGVVPKLKPAMVMMDGLCEDGCWCRISYIG